MRGRKHRSKSSDLLIAEVCASVPRPTVADCEVGYKVYYNKVEIEKLGEQVMMKALNTHFWYYFTTKYSINSSFY